MHPDELGREVWEVREPSRNAIPRPLEARLHPKARCTGELRPLPSPLLALCARDKPRTRGMEAEHGSSEAEEGGCFLCCTPSSPPAAGSPPYTAGLILVAQMFCSGRRHTDPSVPWSAGTCCTSGRSTEEMNGARSFKGRFAGKSPSAL